MDWSCQVCTLLNSPSVTECSVCGSDRQDTKLSDEAYAHLLAREEEAGNPGANDTLGEEAEGDDHADEDLEEDEEEDYRPKRKRKAPSKKHVATPAPEPLTEFERERLAKIKRNQEQLALLGLPSLVAATTGTVKATKPVSAVKKKVKKFGMDDSDSDPAWDEKGATDDSEFSDGTEASGEDQGKKSSKKANAKTRTAPKRPKKSQSKEPSSTKTSKRTPSAKRVEAKSSDGDEMQAFLAANRSASKAESKSSGQSKCKQAPNEFSVQDMRDCFKLLDKDQDGHLTYTDLVLSCFAAKEEMSDEAIQAMLGYGSHKTGKISLADFLELAKKPPIRAR